MPQNRPRRTDGRMLSELRMFGATLPIGATAHGELCPRCGGGRNRERSLSVTRLDALRLAYCCHRATCSAHGFIGGTPGSSTGESKPIGENRSGRSQELYTLETVGLGKDWKDKLSRNCGFTEDDIDWLGWTEEAGSGRLVVYIRDPDGKRRGIHTRAARVGEKPKTRDYRESDSEWMGWYRNATGDGSPHNKSPIVLVEDVLSAAKVATAGYVSASLMGSNLTLGQLREVQTVSRDRPIILALDRDATDKALEIVSKYAFLGNLIPLLLSKDLKYHTKEEIQKMVQDLGLIE